MYSIPLKSQKNAVHYHGNIQHSKCQFLNTYCCSSIKCQFSMLTKVLPSEALVTVSADIFSKSQN